MEYNKNTTKHNKIQQNQQKYNKNTINTTEIQQIIQQKHFKWKLCCSLATHCMHMDVRTN